MEECFKCRTPETKALLFDVILPKRLDKICGKCSSIVNFPIIKKVSASQEKAQTPTVRETLSRISGIKLEERKKNIEKAKQEDIKLREIVKENTRKKFTFDSNLSKELIDHFHWIVMRARRLKHITKEELARSIQESVEIIELVEKGEFRGRREVMLKLETFLGISIFKRTEENKPIERIQEINQVELKEKPNLDFKNVDNLTISNLQEIESQRKKVVVAVSGYFDPVHVGHLELIQKSRALGDKLIVILNNDYQTALKKGRSFMPEQERIKIMQSIKGVDEVVLSIDKDKTQCETLRMLKPDIFAQGGDRHQGEVPETPVCKEFGIKQVDSMGEKIQSSSELVRKSNLQ